MHRVYAISSYSSVSLKTHKKSFVKPEIKVKITTVATVTRKHFPETWIWDDVNEKGFVKEIIHYMLKLLLLCIMCNVYLLCYSL